MHGALNLNGPSNPAVIAGGGVVLADTSMTPGSGITAGFAGGCIYRSRVYQLDTNVLKTEIYMDLTGLNSGDTDGDIIGYVGTANCHIGQITTAVNGLIFKGTISCVETPAGGEPDIDVYSADEATGTEEAAVSGLVETAILAAAADWTKGVQKNFTGNVVADQYLYLVASGGATNATYTAGMFFIELWGYVI